MIINKMFKLILNIFILNILLILNANSSNHDFQLWLNNFKIKAVNSGISKNVVNEIMNEAKFLPKVIEYDRFQPEFYEDTFTYIKKRSSKSKVKDG